MFDCRCPCLNYNIKMKQEETKQAKGNRRLWILIVILALVVGIIFGTSVGIKVGERQAFENLGIMLDGTTFNVDFNETLMVDRVTENMKEIVWDLRMENCTRTEKSYCALECYENSKLIPCENFTYDEHFCNEGICEASGGCPDYFEILEGKTIEDCIREVEDKFTNERDEE